MPKNIIFYFTGTGNSLKAAKDIAAVLRDTELVSMKGSYQLKHAYDRIGFVFPCYAGGAPKAVLEFIKKLSLPPVSAKYLFSVVTCNDRDGNSSIMINKALSKKGLRLNYSNVVRMVGNYTILYDIPDDYLQRLKKADERITGIGKDIENKAQSKMAKTNLAFSLFYRIGNKYFRAKEKQFQVSDACNSCGLCFKLCPMENIAYDNGKPQFLHKNCANCMACIHWCPQSAIDCGNITQKRKRYHHPNINVDELVL